MSTSAPGEESSSARKLTPDQIAALDLAEAMCEMLDYSHVSERANEPCDHCKSAARFFVEFLHHAGDALADLGHVNYKKMLQHLTDKRDGKLSGPPVSSPTTLIPPPGYVVTYSTRSSSSPGPWTTHTARSWK